MGRWSCVRSERVDHVPDRGPPESARLCGGSQLSKIDPLKVWGYDNGCYIRGSTDPELAWTSPFFIQLSLWGFWEVSPGG